MSDNVKELRDYAKSYGVDGEFLRCVADDLEAANALISHVKERIESLSAKVANKDLPMNKFLEARHRRWELVRAMDLYEAAVDGSSK